MATRAETLASQILMLLPPRLRALVYGLPWERQEELEEIRLRAGRPVQLCLRQGDFWLGEGGKLLLEPVGAVVATLDEVQKAFQLISGSSVYALEEELRRGYVTLPGGHRVGMVGKAVLAGGSVHHLKEISALSYRIAQAVPGAADEVLPALWDGVGGRVRHTLILSPPRCGKTTLLRDLVRQLSGGVPALGIPGLKIGLVDERSEIAGVYQGQPQQDVGPRTDVLDACPKAEGIMMLLRAMAPQVVATDELGRPEDVPAVQEALQAGVSVLATAHGRSLEEVSRRPFLAPLLAQGAFERFVVLSRSRGPGTLVEIRAAEREEGSER